ncbi:Glycolate dehydrogenase, FAD-binding subunit GlcE [hydrothermal vent metagenome]|uniref:Glycolate dehydrogenase, FAD-binding subunit GlcE n=1 Tax=hydrothermal vent metagenome TaxID=652676 RepID=A0A1W1E3R4_9ZZZZ
MYANGGQDLSDSVLGVQIIDGNGELLNFGGQVMKNVAGYDVARLLVGSKGQLAMVTQISFKVMPSAYVDKLNASVKLENKSVLRINQC